MSDGQPTQDSAQPSGLEGGNYEIIRKRLIEHGQKLAQKAQALNQRRLETFGSSRMEILGTRQIHTENNCVPRDIVNVNGQLLLGYNVSFGLRDANSTAVGEVFSLHELRQTEGEGEGPDFEFVPQELAGTYLNDDRFIKNFADLYRYNKDTHLQLLRVTDGRLLAVFQIGRSVKDVRVFQWLCPPGAAPTYVDDRGDRFHTFPPSHDFTWTETTREDFRFGEHPHVSIRDRVFVECVGGDLTVKVENNTTDGQGIYREDVDDPHQALQDAEIAYAELGHVILLRVKPYREEHHRYLAYSALSHRVERIDAIGTACIRLPEDHGIIFPGGYFLNDGEFKRFDLDVKGLEFKRVIRSPNGEDVLYVFHRRDEGLYALLQYNLIRKEVSNPILTHGYSFFDDGKLVVFRATGEATRHHQMQIWQTPFTSDAFAAAQPRDGSFLTRVGNAELVRGVSECLSLQRAIANQQPTVQIYDELIRQTTRLLDGFYWMDKPEVDDMASTVKAIRQTAELIIDEFQKVQAMRRQATEALALAEEHQSRLVARLRPEHWTEVERFTEALAELRKQRGHLITLREMRYMNVARVNELEAQVIEANDRLSKGAVDFLLKDTALDPYHKELDDLTEQIDQFVTVAAAEPLRKRLTAMSESLDLLNEIVNGLQIDDATARTRILENLGEVFAKLNRTKALLETRRKSLSSHEAVAEFGAQFKLFGQSVNSALGLVDTPEKCDDQLSRLLIQLEELESRFSEFDQFLGDLAAKREEVYEAFESRKQTLLEERQRRAANLSSAAARILQGVARRARSFTEDDALNAYFASDAMILKVRDLSGQLRALGDTVKADDVDAQLKAARDQALRALRDKQEIYEEGEAVIRLGRHRFSVNTQELELTMLPREDRMVLHMTGTEFFEELDDEALAQTRTYWSQTLVSERDEVYRGEYLAYSILRAAETGKEGMTLARLRDATRESGGLLALVRAYAAERYDEGYDRGLHDEDAVKILNQLMHLRDTGGLLRFPARPRALACLYWAFALSKDQQRLLNRRARSLGRLRASLGHVHGLLELGAELATAIGDFARAETLEASQGVLDQAGEYLAEELACDQPRFVTSAEASQLRDLLMAHLDTLTERQGFEADLKSLEGSLKARVELVRAWFGGLLEGADEDARQRMAPVRAEAEAMVLTERRLDREITSAMTTAEVTGLLGQHPRVQDRTLRLRLDEFIPRLAHFVAHHVPSYRRYRELRQQILERERLRLRLEEYKPRVLTSFVRNKLISEVFLPIIGDNLAKQMGALGDQKRTDLMGLLLLISPPGYGKTTLMEYVANRLGLVFMKINGPALGHSVTSLDPTEAPNATARQELLKLNLALEMGNNVMLYVDDIQHTHPEFLQKFISLCDAQRRIEGVWKGRTRTYDLRGKKFCVVMAGNPYTESGEKFQIPDMLSNRADTRNLGDELKGNEGAFAMSYVENSLTSNPTLAPLSTRPPEDTYKLLDMAAGAEIQIQELKHNYSAVEVGEITGVLKKLFKVRDVLLKVNQTYITSAGQDDAYRTEPPFKLQGSYRNMNKVAEKVAAVMNDQELEALIDDHYTNEAQTLTTGAEQNLLKLAELRKRMSPEQKERWDSIKKEFVRRRMMGGAEDDPVARVTGQLAALVQEVEGIGGALARPDLLKSIEALRLSVQATDPRPALETLASRMAEQSLKPELAALASGMVDQSIKPELATLTRQMAQHSVKGELGAIMAAMASQNVKSELGTISQSIVQAAEAARAAQEHTLAQQARHQQASAEGAAQQLQRVAAALEALSTAQRSIQIVNKPSTNLEEIFRQQVEVIEWTLVPLVRTMAQDLQGGREIWERLGQVLARLKGIDPASLATPVVHQVQGTPVAHQVQGTPAEPTDEGWGDPGAFPVETNLNPQPPAEPPAQGPRGPSSGVIRKERSGPPTQKLPPVKGKPDE